MTIGVVPGASIAGMVFSLVVSFALPIGLFVYAKKKLGAKTAPFFIGCGVFFVMVLMLEAAIHRIVFQLAGEALTGSVILYAVYGGLMAALFEETGRYIAMRFLVKPMDFPNAFMYGAGHGGVEAMLLCGVASISNIASAVMINSGTMSAQLATLDAEKAADTAAALSALWTTPSLTFFAGGVERIIAVVLHLSLSILVFQSIRKKSQKDLLNAYLFHFVIDSRQYAPNHFHWYKTEDIINRGGGNALIRVYNSLPDEEIDYESDVTVHTDGRSYHVPAGTQIRLTPGESIHVQQRLYHDFSVEEGTGAVLLGEVSQCNDDNTDNRFNPPVGRFPRIEEDEPPYRLLCNEYPAAKE